jgi:hypothetical protein
VFVVVAGMLAGGCVDLRYPPGASRDGGPAAPQRPNGQACLEGADCASGFCADGVCCKDKCEGPCHFCRKPGSFGFCMPAEADDNPRGLCKEDGCAQVAQCDGAGACKKKNQGETCGPPVKCVAFTATLAGRCDDKGVCQPGPTQDCLPYFCGEDLKCRTSCTTSDDCRNGTCKDGMCDKKGLGTACTNGSECILGICANGVCCKTTCAGPCYSCALEGSAGTCTPVPAGTKPADVAVTDSTCSEEPAMTCGLDGTCDGAGACRQHVAGKTCAPPSCANASLRPAGTCDGKGKCQMPATVTCGGYTCASAMACRTTCNADAECASPAICGGTKDAACGGLSAQYFRQTNLTDMAFTRTDAKVEFDWMGGSPSPLLNVDNFSVRWRGKITARFTEPYTFYVGSDDGERLWVNGMLIIDRFVRHASVPEDVSKVVSLVAGQPVDIQLEYFENGGDSNVRMLWWSKSEPKAVVPTSALSPQ